jgi:uncharacterized protein YfaS (alpha-2-macroglobulin family)
MLLHSGTLIHSLNNQAQASTAKKIETYSYSDWAYLNHKSIKNSGPNRKTAMPTASTDFGWQRTNEWNSSSESKNFATDKQSFLTAVSTDKPIYRTNEKLYVRGVLLNSYNHKPLNQNKNATADIHIRGPQGEIVASGKVSATNSIWTFAWDIPDNLNGGEYLIEASYAGNDCLPAIRKFELQDFREPRLSSRITFARNAYGPGESVNASLKVKRTEGGFPTGARVSIDARVDGTIISVEPRTVDAKGECSVSFNLPSKIAHSQGTLAMTIQDGGVIETTTKSIPLILQPLNIETYPEGGELVADCKNRVYVQTLRPDGKPADVVASVVVSNDGKAGKTVTQFRTEHEGRGRFEFTPDANTTYALKILKPEGVRVLYPLQPVNKLGAIIRANRDVYKKGEPITLSISSTKKKLHLVISKRQQKLVTRNIEFDQTQPESKSWTLGKKVISVALPSEVDGVLIATITDDRGFPLAERLIFREAAKPLTIRIKPDKAVYGPQNSVKLSVKTTDDKGKPVSAMVGVVVTDESVLKLVDKRERAPRLPVMMYLEPEIQDLAAASVYFDRKNPKAPLAIDLLLGTQGWRRFAVMDVSKFVMENGDNAKRAISFNDASTFYNGSVLNYTPAPIVRGRMTPQEQFKAAFGAPLRGNMASPHDVTTRSAHLLTPQPVPLPGYSQSDLGEARRPSARWDFAPNVWRKETIVTPSISKPRSPFGNSNWLTTPEYFRVAPSTMRLLQTRRTDRWTPPARIIEAKSDFKIVRVYAHQIPTNGSTSERKDFQDTLYWNAGIKTDAKTGTAVVTFKLNDSVTTFQAFADGFTDAGSLGDAAAEVKSHRAFYLEAKFPTQISGGDQIKLPVNIINDSGTTLGELHLNVDIPKVLKEPLSLAIQNHVKSGERLRRLIPINIGFGQRIADLGLGVSTNSYHDKIVRQLRIKPTGMPTEKCFGGMVAPDRSATFKINIEKNIVPESIETHIQLLTSPLAKLTAALERLIQEPCGCFEQTAATSYPLTMAQQYFITHTDVDANLIRRSKENLEIGYKKLLGYRCSDMGFECFGKAPSDTVLTAYGLLQFSDMAKVMDVDRQMIESTRSWLRSKKDGQGGFRVEHHSGHAWSADQDCSNAYIVWALLESGESPSNLTTELARLKNVAKSSQNEYVVALAANAFTLAGQPETAKTLMDNLASQQQADGSINGITNSIVGSDGDALKIEGTALATLAWLGNPDYMVNVQRSIKFLTESCQGGRYSSTQATVLALRCIVAYDKLDTRAKTPGRVHLYIDGTPSGNWVSFDSSNHEPIKLADLSKLLSSGEHTIEIRMEEGNSLPYTAAIKYNKQTPNSDKNCKIDLSVRLSQSKLIEGKTTEANVIVTNITNTTVASPIAIIGIPAGLEPRHDQLRELVKSGQIAAYEVKGNDVVLYWRDMSAKESIRVSLSLVASFPGTYTGSASNAYLYYADEHKKWIDGLPAEIIAK